MSHTEFNARRFVARFMRIFPYVRRLENELQGAVDHHAHYVEQLDIALMSPRRHGGSIMNEHVKEIQALSEEVGKIDVATKLIEEGIRISFYHDGIWDCPTCRWVRKAKEFVQK